MGVEAELDEEAASRRECLAVSWHIELDRDGFQQGSFTLGDITFDVTDYLAIEVGLLFGEQVCLLVQVHRPFAGPFLEKRVGEGKRFFTELSHQLRFAPTRICLEKYRTLHDSNHHRSCASSSKACRQFLPRFKTGVSLPRFL